MENRILVVDDDVMNLRMAEFILNKNGYTVIKAESAKEAFDITFEKRGDERIIKVKLISKQ